MYSIPQVVFFIPLNEFLCEEVFERISLVQDK